MPIQTIKFVPGVNAEVTDTQGIAQITSSQLIRFRFAGQEVLPEKLGGWDKFYPLSVGSPVRDLHAWEGIINDTYLAVGAEDSLSVITEGVGYDITPRTLTTNPAISVTTVNGDAEVTIDDAGITMSPYNSIYISTPIAIDGLVLFGSYAVESVIDADTYTIIAASAATSSTGPGGVTAQFSTTNASSVVQVNLNNHGYAVGEIFPVLISTTVGGITFFGPYIINAINTANQFEIIAASAATSTTTGYLNGGNARITYYITLPPSASPTGYGGGGYGLGAYGTGLLPTPSTGTALTTTNWTLDNWGAFLLACPADGAIYYWSPYGGFTQATKIVNAPEINGGIFVSQSAQILVAWASSFTGVFDPLSINWSAVSDFENWTVSSQTQAGGYRLPTGSRIIGGMASPNFNIIWTDIEVWAMNYIGPPLVYGFSILGSNCGLVGRHAYAVLNSVVYWMGEDQFFMLNGETVNTIPCSVWDFVFQDLDLDNLDKVCAASNALFGEVTFYFPSVSGGTGENDSYVKFSPVLNTWDFGRLDRSAWIDKSPVGRPVGAASTGYIYQHETSPDADGQPMNSWFETGYFSVSEGENLNFVDWLIPDFRYGYLAGDQDAVVQMTFNFTDYPSGTEKTRGPYSVSSATEYVNARLRARFASVRFESNDLGSFWRLGAVKIRSVPDGKR